MKVNLKIPTTLNDVTLAQYQEFSKLESKLEDTNGATNYVVRYPLIAPRRLTYDDGGANDINTNTGAIQYTELFPSIRLLKEKVSLKI